MNDTYSPHTGEHIATDSPAPWMGRAGTSAPEYNPQTQAQLNNVTAVANDLADTHGRFVDALQQFQSTQQANQLVQQDLGRVLLDLRGVTSGLRGDFASLPGRIERASRATLGQYASTCTAVFEAMAAGGGRLAEAGAGVSAKADGHAADVGLMQGAWPK